MDLMTQTDFEALLNSDRGHYYQGRWAYFSEVIRMIEGLAPGSALEIGRSRKSNCLSTSTLLDLFPHSISGGRANY
ncbi:MAG: hypothetical protein GF331_03660 [Chitinivibrionales bacterium]|nr:hypothetical protein [Chitinivibrionales bacterium]